jgi:hypothetical protein
MCKPRLTERVLAGLVVLEARTFSLSGVGVLPFSADPDRLVLLAASDWIRRMVTWRGSRVVGNQGGGGVVVTEGGSASLG